MLQFSSWREALRKTEIAAVCLFVGMAAIVCGGEPDSMIAELPTLEQIAADYALIKERYVRFLTGTDKTLAGELGSGTTREFLRRLRRPIARAMAFDYDRDGERPFRALPEDPGHKEETSAFSPLLQQYVLSLAYCYCVNAPGNPHYRNPDVLQCNAVDSEMGKIVEWPGRNSR